MFRLILILISSILLAACSTTETKVGNPPEAEELSIVGIWAMIPLRNGIANVVEFTADGKSDLHLFNCKTNSSEGVESSTYEISEDGKTLHLDFDGKPQDLNIIAMTKNTLRLGQPIADIELKFMYVRINKISPLCSVFKALNKEKTLGTPYTKSDFIDDPWIPDNPNIERYVGKWVSEKENVSFEIISNGAGKYKITHPSSRENWYVLTNNVHWEGDELHYQLFSYTTLESQFKHPAHKSIIRSIITPVDDKDKIQWSFFFGEKRVDHIMTRVGP